MNFTRRWAWIVLCLCVSDAALAQDPVVVRQVVGSDFGVSTTVRPDKGDYFPPPLSQEGLECIRWIDSSPPSSWIPWQIDIGDRGASVVMWGFVQDRHVAVYAGGSDDALFGYADRPTDYEAVAAAARGPMIARIRDRLDESAGTRHMTLSAHLDYEDGLSVWSYDFPFHNLSDIAPAPTVVVSSDGSRVISVTGRYRRDEQNFVHIQSFSGDGVPGTVLTLEDTAFHGAVDASDDGGVLALTVFGWPHIVDVDAGVVEHLERGRVSDDIAVSGDGGRVAWGGTDRIDGERRGRLVVVQRDAQGSWPRLRNLSFPAGSQGTEVVALAINEDGSRVALALQDDTLTRFTTILYDVDGDQILFEQVTENPATATQLKATVVTLDDRGETVGVTSWGDSDQLTKEVQFFDSDGVPLVSFNARGSALDLALTRDGEHFVAAATTGHANTGMRSGDLFYGSTRTEPLRIQGVPKASETLQFELNPPSGTMGTWIGVGTVRLEDDPGGLELNPNHLLLFEGLQGEQSVPPGLEGLDLYFQGLFVDDEGRVSFGNTESIRFVN